MTGLKLIVKSPAVGDIMTLQPDQNSRLPRYLWT